MKDSDRKYFDNLSLACREGMKLAGESPGPYGGRYISRTTGDEFIVLDGDDPEVYKGDAHDIYAHVTPEMVYPIGHARGYLEEDGSINWDALA